MFDQVWEIVAVCAIVAIVLVAGVVGLVRGRSSRQKELTPPPPPPKPSSPTAPPTDLDSDADGGGVDTLPAPTPTRPAEPEVDDDILVEELPTLERPASARGRLARLRARLARSNTAIGNALLVLLSRGGLDEEAWEEVEDTLIRADLGVDATNELVERLRTKVKVDGSGATSEAEVKAWLKADLLDLVDPEMDRRIASSRIDGRPAVILVVGVNGTGKTTTVGKLARVLVSEDRDVILGAADTFRAAAADQLETWGARVGVPTIRSEKEGADPAAVAFDALEAGRARGTDVVIVDTAGRLHTQGNLMEELAKIRRVITGRLDGAPHETLLVVDATTGQNGLQQARLFSEAAGVTGVVLTKLDGSAKGGVAIAIAHELGLPVKLVGVGEGVDDLRPFDARDYARALVA